MDGSAINAGLLFERNDFTKAGAFVNFLNSLSNKSLGHLCHLKNQGAINKNIEELGSDGYNRIVESINIPTLEAHLEYTLEPGKNLQANTPARLRLSFDRKTKQPDSYKLKEILLDTELGKLEIKFPFPRNFSLRTENLGHDFDLRPDKKEISELLQKVKENLRSATVTFHHYQYSPHQEQKSAERLDLDSLLDILSDKFVAKEKTQVFPIKDAQSDRDSEPIRLLHHSA